MPGLSDLPIPLDLQPMEAKLVEAPPEGPGWRYEPKWDGFRCLAYRAGGEVALRAKSGKPLDRFFPDMVEALKALPVKRFVIDGELTIAVDGTKVKANFICSIGYGDHEKIKPRLPRLTFEAACAIVL